ncbi:MAG TPA: tetratricopeptide repeat protein [Candidatus Obscuribacterales bacterium]
MNTSTANAGFVPFPAQWSQDPLSAFRRARSVLRKITEDYRYRWFQRAVGLFYLIWSGIVVVQSIAYYVYSGEAKQAFDRHCYAQAETLFIMAASEVERSASYQLMGERDSRHIKALNNLAEVYRAAGRFRQAEALGLEVNSIAESDFGKTSEASAISLNNLAAVYRDEGRFQQSEELYAQSLNCWQAMRRTHEQGYAAVLYGLGQLRAKEGKSAEAEQLRCLAEKI